MPRRLLATIIAVVLLVVAPPQPITADQELPPVVSPHDAGPPNIVVFYLDDTSPHDGRLWNDPELTPAIYDHFVAHGVRFSNAIVETPLCCPARSGLLTGLHTHNHGVKVTDARLFHPSEHIGHALQRAGYETLMVGKYLNRADLLSPEQWQEHAAGWTQMDVFNNNEKLSAQQFYGNYSLFTKQGPPPVIGDKHSTQLIGERTVLRMAQVSPERPLFALVSVFNTHYPNIPMPGFDTSRCDAMPPWNPPSYNEADVSDKPGQVRNQALQPYPDGWPLTKYCREMFGVDWVVGQVTAELEREGRLDNTLLVFTADNGMTWGEHRLPQEKQWPYATPVPLYMSWPARWGSHPRVIDEYTTNIDLAPTWCDLAGCSLGPYETGQPHPDGVSLVPLLDGQAERLGRDAILETSYQTRVWSGLRTTWDSPFGRWHYVEWAGGARELYDSAADPWELNSLAGMPAYAELQAALARRLAGLLAEGVPARAVGGQPDAGIGLWKTGPFKRLGKINTAPAKRQTQRLSGIRAGGMYDFTVHVQTDSPFGDAVRISATSAIGTGMAVTFLEEGVDITARVTSAGYEAEIAPGGWALLTVRVSGVGMVPRGSVTTVVVTARSVVDPDKIDVVRAVARR